MSSDLSIGAVAPDPAIRTTEAAPAQTAPPPTASANAPGIPNPTLHLDSALGLVVIEFVSQHGTITSSIPSQRELTAYQDGTAQPQVMRL